MDAFVFEAGIMGDEAGSTDSLTRAIDGFRRELLLWIDTELARLQALEQDERADPSRMGSGISRDREGSADRNSDAEMARSPVTLPASGADLETQAAPLNSCQRLDALARLLDRRLKEVEGAAPAASQGAIGGRSNGLRDESNSDPCRRRVQ
jgi:hypothetical protein